MEEHELVIVAHRGVNGQRCLEYNVSRGVREVRPSLVIVGYSCFALYTNISVKPSCVLCQFI